MSSPDSAVPGLDILFVLAHPDDETFGHAGLMAWAKATGLRAGVVCATRGEQGEISDPSLGTPEMLGAVRERELRRAMTVVGTDLVRLLSYRDSGMAGTPANDDPRSLVQADHDAVLADVVFQIRDLRPHAVVTFGPDGIYGHPDHIRIGAITTEAAEVAARETWPFLGCPWRVSRLFYASVAREDLREMKQRGSGYFARVSDEEIEQMGSPASEITHIFDVRPYAEIKVQAITCHATQLPFNPAPGTPGDPQMRPRLGKESLRRAPLPWDSGDTDFLDTFATTERIPV